MPRKGHFSRGFRPLTGKTPALCGLQLEIAVDEVVLLEPPEALADLARAHGPHALDGLELALRGAHDRFEAAHVRYDAVDHGFREARDVGEDAVATGRDAVVGGVDVVGITEQLRKYVEVEERLVRQRSEPEDHLLRLAVAAALLVVEHHA